MAKYKLTNEVKNDLIRIHHYGVEKFGITQANKYFDTFFEYFDRIAERPFSFESVDHIKTGYRHCVCVVDSIYFRITENDVEIITIIGRKDLNKKLVQSQKKEGKSGKKS